MTAERFEVRGHEWDYSAAALYEEGRKEGLRDWLGLVEYWRSLYGYYDPSGRGSP